MAKFPQTCRDCRTGPKRDVEDQREEPPAPAQPTPPPTDPTTSTTPAPLDEDDLADRLLAFLQLQATGMHRDVTVYTALNRRGIVWLKENKVEDERIQMRLLTRVMDKTMLITPEEEKLKSNARSIHWMMNNLYAKDFGRGIVHTMGLRKRLGVLFASQVGGSILGVLASRSVGRLIERDFLEPVITALPIKWQMNIRWIQSSSAAYRHLTTFLQVAAGFGGSQIANTMARAFIKYLTVVDLQKD
jgi:hypothetical protein